MALNKKSIEDIDVKGKKVLARCDFNVPLDGDGNITDDKRIVESLPTIKYLLGQGAKLILCSHLGRPKGEFNMKYSLKPVAARLSELLGIDVPIAADVIGESAKALAANLQDGQCMLLENLRFHKQEEKNDDGFAAELASMAEIYVNDAFGTSHRAHASTAGVTKYLPAVCGYLLQKEIDLIDKVDALIIGGGMAYTFQKALGGSIGGSICEDDKLTLALDMMKKAESRGVKFLLPLDNVAGDAFSNDCNRQTVKAGTIPDGWEGMDIGPETIELFSENIQGAGTVVWNGPMGVFEFPNFAVGTKAVAKAVGESGAVSIIGGGDSAAAVEQLGYADKMTHISTGGGASLEFLEGIELPAIACLADKD